MNNNKKSKRLGKWFLINSIVMIFICFMYLSGTRAQWPMYDNTDWFSQPSLNSPFSFNSLSSYEGFSNNWSYPSYESSFSSGLYSFPALSNGTSGTGYTPYGGFNTYGLYSYPGLWSPGGASFGGYGYPWSNTSFLPSPYSSPFLSPWSWTGGGLMGGYGLFSLFPPYPGDIIPVSQPRSYCDPASAPGKLSGEWSSQQLEDEEENALTGELSISRGNDNDTIRMMGSTLPLGEDVLTEFKYTRTAGEAPISFKGSFYSGYTAYFTGTADNRLCCRNHYCAFAGVFEVEGEYKVKDKLGQIVDKGTFTIKGPVSSSKPRPTPAEAIHDLGKPIDEGKKVLSLTTGADGRIYGGTNIGCQTVGHMFVYDPVTEEITDLGNPGYECNAMTTGTDGLIYLGGGTRSLGDHECKSIGYANFAVYDPSKNWNPGQGSNANPRDLGQAVNFNGEVEGYPIVVHDLATTPDGKIYGCTGYRDGTWEEYYAHLFVYDPQTNIIEDLGHPISNQSSITRLAITPDGLIYGVILGPRTGYKPPPGKFFSYDPVTTSYNLINMPSSIEGIVDLTAGKDGLIYGAGDEGNSTIFSYDPVSKSFDVKGSLGGCGDVLRMISAADGIIYIGCAVNGYFVRYDPERAFEDRPYSEANDKPGVNPRMFHWTGKVNALTEGQDGTIYFGNLSGQLFSFAGEEEPSSQQ